MVFRSVLARRTQEREIRERLDKQPPVAEPLISLTGWNVTTNEPRPTLAQPGPRAAARKSKNELPIGREYGYRLVRAPPEGERDGGYQSYSQLMRTASGSNEMVPNGPPGSPSDMETPNSNRPVAPTRSITLPNLHAYDSIDARLTQSACFANSIPDYYRTMPQSTTPLSSIKSHKPNHKSYIDLASDQRLESQLVSQLLIKLQTGMPSNRCGFCYMPNSALSASSSAMLPCGHAFHETCARNAILLFLTSDLPEQTLHCPCCAMRVLPPRRTQLIGADERGYNTALVLYAGRDAAWAYYGAIWTRWTLIETAARKHHSDVSADPTSRAPARNSASYERREHFCVMPEAVGTAYLEVDSLIWVHAEGERAALFDLREKASVDCTALVEWEGTLREREVLVWMEVASLVSAVAKGCWVTREELCEELKESLSGLLVRLYRMRYAVSEEACGQLVEEVVRRWVVLVALLCEIKM